MKSLTIAIILLMPAFAFSADFAQADLAMRARVILRSHCSECHGEKPSRSSMSVFDHAKLTKDRLAPSIIKPRDATASQLLELIEDGSMPPGIHKKLAKDEIDVLREWIAKGATAYPLRFDDDYVLNAIANDVEKLSQQEIDNSRYLSFAHLAESGNFIAKRTEVLNTLEKITKAKASPVTPVDTNATVFRFDLKTSGWDLQPFVIIDEKAESKKKVERNLFDFVLLEYPDAYQPANSPSWDRFVNVFLRKAKQIRPAPFVKADWFSDAATRSPLALDLSRIMQPAYGKVPGFTNQNDKSALRSRSDTKEFRMMPVDGWHSADPPSDHSSVPDLVFELLDTKTEKPRKTTLVEGESFKIRVKASVPIFFEFCWFSSDGKVDPNHTPIVTWSANKDWIEEFPKDGSIGGPFGEERLVLYVSTKKFEPAVIWHWDAKGSETIERYVHNYFYELQQRGQSAAITPTHITRRTIPIVTVPKGK